MSKHLLISHKHHAGLTLIEAAIILTVLGILVGALFSMYNSARKQEAPRETRKKMETIVTALSSYVETYNRLPCPADPSLTDEIFGWEWNITPNPPTVTAAGTPMGECRGGGGELTGIVPFQTLNLPANTVRDGWGNYFTYAVSPIFTLDNDANAPNPFGYLPSDVNDRVHERCRDGTWIDLLDNVNAPKARFCCAVDLDDAAAPGFFPPGGGNPNRDLVISQHTPGNVISPARDALGAGNYDDIRTPLADGDGRITTYNTATTVTAPAFVLVSHGEDGRGAFLANDTPNQLDTNGTFVLEQENWDGDRTYLTGPSSLGNNAANYFDDIVVWMTQDGLMAANGTSSCQQP